MTLASGKRLEPFFRLAANEFPGMAGVHGVHFYIDQRWYAAKAEPPLQRFPGGCPDDAWSPVSIPPTFPPCCSEAINGWK